MCYLDEWAGRVAFARGHRRALPNNPDPCEFDPDPPERYSAEDVEFALKLVAHWEGGPDPHDPAAVAVVLKRVPEWARERDPLR